MINIHKTSQPTSRERIKKLIELIIEIKFKPGSNQAKDKSNTKPNENSM
jgi:hypothetical protein